MKKLCILFLLCFAFSTVAEAKRGVYIELYGDEIVFDQESTGVSANRNVTLLYNDYIVSSNAFKYSKAQKIIRFPDNFEINNEDMTQHINGSYFNYDLQTYKGVARDLFAKFGRVKVEAKEMKFYSTKIVLVDAIFTTCDHGAEASNYSVEAKKMIIYPQWGFFVAMNTKIRTGLLPFPLPIPTYVYGAKRYGLSSTTSLIPDVGTNMTEGFFIKERIAYFVNPESQGAILFGATESFGGYAGFEHGISVGKNKEVYVTGIAAQRDEFSGRAQFNWDLWKIKEEETDVLAALLKNFTVGQDLPRSRLSFVVAEREIVNDERVSLAPSLEFKANSAPLIWMGLMMDASLSHGKVIEEIDDEDDFQAWRTNAESKIFQNKYLSEAWDLRSELNYSGFWYDTGTTWQRFYATFVFKNKTSILEPTFSFTKRLLPVFGESPFNHESNFALVSDEVGLSLTYTPGRFSIGNKIDYNIQDYEIRNFDIIFGMKLTCWTAFINFQTEQNAINFGFDLD